MTTPFKTKDINEDISQKDIKSLMEQANYTNKYLQVIGEPIGKEKIFTKFKDKEVTPSHVQFEKPLFMSKLKNHYSNHLRLVFLKTIPETPQTSEDSHKIRTRQTSKLINIIDKDNDKTSNQASKDSSMSKKEINSINTKNWKTPSKLYYERPTAPDLLLEE
ncbi:hypothetical protein CR513_15996, partial [Mucuna pruriens]